MLVPSDADESLEEFGQTYELPSHSGSPALRRPGSTEALHLVAKIAAAPVSDLEGFSRKFSAILWAMETNDSLLDTSDLRRLRAFGREIRRVAAR